MNTPAHITIAEGTFQLQKIQDIANVVPSLVFVALLNKSMCIDHDTHYVDAFTILPSSASCVVHPPPRDLVNFKIQRTNNRIVSDIVVTSRTITPLYRRRCVFLLPLTSL